MKLRYQTNFRERASSVLWPAKLLTLHYCCSQNLAVGLGYLLGSGRREFNHSSSQGVL